MAIPSVVQIASTLARCFAPPQIYVAVKPLAERLLKLEEREVAIVSRLPFVQTRCAIDVGDNWGTYTTAMLRRFDNVEAFEPIASCSSALRAYARSFQKALVVHEIGRAHV